MWCRCRRVYVVAVVVVALFAFCWTPSSVRANDDGVGTEFDHEDFGDEVPSVPQHGMGPSDGFVVAPPRSNDPKIVSRDVKCLVCNATITEMNSIIRKVSPRKMVEVSGFRIDSKDVKRVPLVKSESYLTELMESVCKSMDDYAKARIKTTRELIILKMTSETGGMNPMMSEVDFVQDGDLNKSLEHFCLEVLEDHEETFLKYYMSDEVPADVNNKICTEAANYCDEQKLAPKIKTEL